MSIKISIMIPAIIDQDCADAVVPSIKENIILPNVECDFTIFLNIDNYCRSGCRGDVNTILSKYNELAEEPNCVVDVVVHNNCIGLAHAAKSLFERFIKSDSDYLMFLDDDCVIINPVSFSEIIDLVDFDNNQSIFHLAFGYDDNSTENPFIRNIVYFDGELIKVFKNSRSFSTENGTIFMRKMVHSIVDEYANKFNPNVNPEDNVGILNCYRGKQVLTIAFKNNLCEVSEDIEYHTKPLWRLPKENHFIIDCIRHYSRGHHITDSWKN